MRKIVLGIISLLALSLILAAIGIIGYRVVLAANSKPTPAKSSYYPSDWFSSTTVPLPTPTIPFGLTWKRTGGLATACSQLSLAESAQGQYSSCGQGPVLAELTTVEYRQYLYYLSQYAPFAYSHSLDSGTGTTWLWFGGHGESQATLAEESDIATWAEAVYLRFKQEEGQAVIVAAVRLTLATHLGISADEITTEYVKAVDWPNACLGLYLPGVDCAQVRIAGYQVILVTSGVRYEYRTNLYDTVRLAGSATLTPTPLPATPTPILPTPQNMPTVTPSATPSVTASPTATASPTVMPSPTATSHPTKTASPTVTASPTLIPSRTATPSPTATASPTVTSSPTATTRPTVTPSPTATASPTVTASPTATMRPTIAPSPTITPSPTATTIPTATASPTETASPTATPSPTMTASPTGIASATPVSTPNASPTIDAGGNLPN